MAAELRPYVLALFEAAQEAGLEETIEAELAELDKIWKENPDYRLLLRHPGITRDEKQELLSQLLQGQVSDLLLRFLVIMDQHGLAGQIPDILPVWHQISKEAHGIETVVVETPAALGEDECKALQEMLEKRLQKKTELDVRIRPELIAGLRVRAKDFLLDNSILSRLESMKEQLVESR